MCIPYNCYRVYHSTQKDLDMLFYYPGAVSHTNHIAAKPILGSSAPVSQMAHLWVDM